MNPMYLDTIACIRSNANIRYRSLIRAGRSARLLVCWAADRLATRGQVENDLQSKEPGASEHWIINWGSADRMGRPGHIHSWRVTVGAA